MNINIEENLLEVEEDTQKGKYLTFVLGNEAFGIGIEYVTEIIGILPINEIPEQPEHIRGIVNLRGKIISVMDMRLRFKMPFCEYNERTCIIVINTLDNSIGLIVDSVAEVLSISEEAIVPLPVANTDFSNQFIQGVGKVDNEVKLILDCEKLLSVANIKNVR